MLEKAMNIINSINTNWSKDEIIRFVYVSLAPLFERDLTYFLSPKDIQLQAYRKGFKLTGSSVVCETICEFYLDIFQYLNITAKMITTNEKEVPHYALIVEGDNGWFYIDPLKDLFANQYGLETSFYGVIPNSKYSTVQRDYPYLVTFSKKKLRQEDEKLGLQANGIYLSDFFDCLHPEITDRNKARKYLGIKDSYDCMESVDKKLHFISDNFINYGNVPGLYERKLMYDYLFSKVLDHSERSITDAYFKIINCEHVIRISAVKGENPEMLYEEQKENSKYVLKRLK